MRFKGLKKNKMKTKIGKEWCLKQSLSRVVDLFCGWLWGNDYKKKFAAKRKLPVISTGLNWEGTRLKKSAISKQAT